MSDTSRTPWPQCGPADGPTRGSPRDRGDLNTSAPDDSGGQASAAIKMTRKEYVKELVSLQGELVRLQAWVVREGLKVLIVFEGRDGAGTGGVIKRITERVSPRVFRVVALPAPSDRERGQMDIQRYMAHLPAAGGGRDLRPQLVQPRRRRTGHRVLWD